jgi:hypothetical protein
VSAVEPLLQNARNERWAQAGARTSVVRILSFRSATASEGNETGERFHPGNHVRRPASPAPVGATGLRRDSVSGWGGGRSGDSCRWVPGAARPARHARLPDRRSHRVHRGGRCALSRGDESARPPRSGNLLMQKAGASARSADTETGCLQRGGEVRHGERYDDDRGLDHSRDPPRTRSPGNIQSRGQLSK